MFEFSRIIEDKIDFMFQSDENSCNLCIDYMLCVGMLPELIKEQKKNIAEIE